MSSQQNQKQEFSYEKELLDELKALRTILATRERVTAYLILKDSTLREMATFLPASMEELRKISGFGEIKLQRYGDIFLDCILTYCHTHDLTSRIHLKSPKRIFKERIERDNETKQTTFRLFQEGHSPEKIAEIRKLSITTIENHLAFYVQQGKLAIEQVVDPSKIVPIEIIVDKIGQKTLTRIREALGEDYSFADIRYVMAYLESRQVEEPAMEYAFWQEF